jgi:hypothetical protein
MEGGFAYNPVKDKITKGKTKTKSTAIPHPIFVKLKKHIDDKWWHDFFDRLALNRFPFGFSFYAGNLYYKKGTKPPKIPVVEDTKETMDIVIKFFGTHGSYFSPIDKENKESEVEDDDIEEVYEWKKLKKSEKTLYIENYVDRMSDEWELEDDEKERFFELIFESIDNGQIKGNRINVSKNRIETIDDVNFNENKRSFEIKLTAKRISKPTTKQKADPLTKKWLDAVLKKVKNTAK